MHDNLQEHYLTHTLDNILSELPFLVLGFRLGLGFSYVPITTTYLNFFCH